MWALKRCMSQTVKLQSQNHLRNSSNNLILEYIKEFRTLNEKEKEFILHRIYSMFSTCFTAFNYEEFKDYFLGVQGFSSKAFLLREKTFGLDVGFTFLTLDRFYYKDNDFSAANEYISSYYVCGVLPHYRGGNLGKELYNISENYVRDEYKNNNRVTFNTTLNSMFYEHRTELSPLVFPGPFELPNGEIEKMMKKMMRKYDVKGISEEKPYVYELPAYINNADNKRYLKERTSASKARQFFIDQTGLQHNMFLVNLVIYNLLEDNTLGIKAGEYYKVPKTSIEVVDYTPRFT